MEFTPNALQVLESRYLRRDDAGRVAETPEGLFERVATAVASAEKRSRARWQSRFRDLMGSRRFLPNSPTLMNAGQPRGQLSACYVLPVEDSLEGIFDTLKSAAKIHQSGGGTGFAFSGLRPRGSTVKTTHGTASGPVSFIRIFDVATETIKQGGVRRGANMAVLRVDHPDILEFIRAKRDMRSIVNFNISVGITNEFMRAVSAGAQFALRDPRNGKTTQKVAARALFDEIIESAWECGDPGLVFLDRINLFNPTPGVAAMESTNPCGEQPLLAYESCNLGSLNLGLYRARDSAFDFDRFREDVHAAVRFLDDVVDTNAYPLAETRRITLRNRKIGLGVMGFADLLLLMGIPYDSAEALSLGEKIMSFLDREGKIASCALAAERGAFPNWRSSLWEKLGYPALRNATVSTVAPTGTISVIAGASSGIEPIFSGVFYRNILDGKRLLDVHPAVAALLEERGVSTENLSDDRLTQVLGRAWTPAQKVSVDAHVRMQAAFQRHTDSAVSKTINLPESASREDVRRAYELAYETGCKGITIYRDRSRPSQVLERPAEKILCPEC